MELTKGAMLIGSMALLILFCRFWERRSWSRDFWKLLFSDWNWLSVSCSVPSTLEASLMWKVHSKRILSGKSESLKTFLNWMSGSESNRAICCEFQFSTQRWKLSIVWDTLSHRWVLRRRKTALESNTQVLLRLRSKIGSESASDLNLAATWPWTAANGSANFHILPVFARSFFDNLIRKLRLPVSRPYINKQ